MEVSDAYTPMVNIEFRERMAAVWQRAEEEAEAAKEGYFATLRMMDFYRGLNAEERQLANEVMRDWLISTDAKKRFDALVMVGTLQIRELVPALKELATMLSVSDGPSARDERETVQRTIDELSQPPENTSARRPGWQE